MNENKIRAAIAQNPVLVLLLGACPALAATTAVLPALTLGVTALAVMLLASLFSSLIKKLLPETRCSSPSSCWSRALRAWRSFL